MAYLMNVEPSALDDADNWNLHPRSYASQVWTHLYARRVPDRNPAVVAMMRLGELSTVTRDRRTSWLNAARMDSGGSIPEVIKIDDDPVCDALARCLRDVWPYYLSIDVAAPINLFFLSSCPGLIEHPQFKSAMASFMGDSDLQRIFPYPSQVEEPDDVVRDVYFRYHCSILASSSSTDTVLPFFLANCVLTAAIRTISGHEGALTYEHLISKMREVLLHLRDLGAGKRVKVPALVGFAGFRLEQDCVIDLGEAGRLRSSTDQDSRIFLTDAPGVATVLETTEAIAIHSTTARNVYAGEDFDEPEPGSGEAAALDRETSRRQVDLLRLAVLLSSAPGQLRLTRETGRYVSDMVSPGGAASADLGSPGLTSPMLGSAEVANVPEWVARITDRHCRQMDISMRRLLSAASSRASPSDAFVDAVICWESLFGARADTSFRVCGAMAKVVEPENSERRQSLFGELKKMYGVRSALVHGGKDPKPSELYLYRSRSLEIAIEAMRRLYRDRTDLLTMKSEDRSAEVLLE